MDVLLVNASVKEINRHAGLEPPLGLAYIASVLRENGYDVSAVDFNITGFNPIVLKGIIKIDNPPILGISANTETFPNAVKIADIAKQVNPKITVVIGGPHTSVLYGEAARKKSIDIVVRGEGEYTMLELVGSIIGKKNNPAGTETAAEPVTASANTTPDTISEENISTGTETAAEPVAASANTTPDTTDKENGLARIKGIAYWDGKVKTTPERPFIENLDELPFPARDLFPLPLYNEEPFSILMTRGGCPFRCQFCAVNAVWKGKRRTRSLESVVKEIQFLYEHFYPDEFSFADDTFTLDRQQIIELCGLLKELKKSLPLRWTCATRVDLVDRELLKELHEAGCQAVHYGIEAGSQKILDTIGKRITLEQIRDAVRATLDIGMKVLCSFMFPHPLDTVETVREQKQLMKELLEMGAAEILSFTTPFPGTYLFRNAEPDDADDDPDADELGIRIMANNWDEYDAKHLIITTKYLSEEKLNSLFQEIVQDVGLTNEDLQGSGGKLKGSKKG
jgi:radical SAM superfamily enzyme YgiQ (UPF0313 family)